MSSTAEFANLAAEAEEAAAADGIAEAVRCGLGVRPYTLPAWLFYDERGSELFEQITQLPEYTLTRTERALFERHADEILACAAEPGGRELVFLELGAGTATKTGVLLRAAVRRQRHVLYLPVDVSPSALEEAGRSLTATIAGLTVEPQVANYTTSPIALRRPSGAAVLALYIGSSIGNFAPSEARELLRHLRSQLQQGDALLLGTDLAPGVAPEGKSVASVLAAYDDAAGVTAAFNCNVLTRLNRELGADFDVSAFRHEARWNAAESRIEMHLVAERELAATLPALAAGKVLQLDFAAGESIHTENSYKYTAATIAEMLGAGGFRAERMWTDAGESFAVTLARVL